MTVDEAVRAHAGDAAAGDGQEGRDAGGGRGDGRVRASPGGAAATVAAGRAAQELGLRRGEFELAVHLGLITVVAGPGAGRPRVREREIARLRERPGFPDDLAERVRTVGTADGAALLGIVPARFTRLARAGCVSPVTFYLNRYRAVVWLYLADELAAFAAREPDLLAGRTPPGMRTMLEAGDDRRARNWRSQRIDRLLNRTRDPWARAAVEASALDSAHLAEVVEDPYERAYLVRVRPEPVFGRPGSVAARETLGELMLADDPDEILWRRINLTLELDRAREDRPAPHPGDDPGPGRTPAPAPTPRATPPQPPPAAGPTPTSPIPPTPSTLPTPPTPPTSSAPLLPPLPSAPPLPSSPAGGVPSRVPEVSAKGLLARLRRRRRGDR
ncbi:DUF6397 family protein [Streptomyces sp. NPDC012600]|uniref:DUF6397 family protein n=1 Tax=Streptomyces sp. NPDC012600 TaxID=3415005 RepID=UPI003C2DC370